ncbi:MULTISPECIES: DUF3558 domain-containing protein [unclassified Streptomyces]|uniref:DUF3558 domain-containing protein n=1 Tax=unclassified Streptomyces TaxID=2593676 RepID=UPI001CBF56F6|nr:MULTISPECIES: DUF3558 domain-containing protein [unclassified Streptomyces]WPO72189.1 DUF3558 domain-containing protein [Streptomyces sp. KN37]
MHRPAQRQRQRLSRILVSAAAVPVILVASGCSSDSGSGSDGAKKEAGAKASASKKAGGDKAPAVEEAAYGKLPEPCKVLSKKTLQDLVPEAKDKGKAGTSTDTALRGSCSWDSLDNNGVDGSQFRWLRVSLMRFESDASLGSGAKRAQESFAKQVADAQATKDAKSVKTEPVQGVGEQATLVRYDLKKDKDTFKQQTFVTRVENAVITVDYNGAGLAGDKSPDAGALSKAAQKAAKEAAAAVVSANEDGAKAPSGSEDKPKSDDDAKKSDAKKTDAKSDDAKSDDSESDTSNSKSKSTSKS